MEATLDKFGRLVIPKLVREKLGLGPGSVLEIQQQDSGILLEPRRPEPDLVRENGLLVYTGEIDESASIDLERHRSGRLEELIARSKP